MAMCDDGVVRLPGGAPVSSRLLRSIGGRLGADGGSEEIHYLLERDPRSPAFGHDLAGLLPFTGRAPLYAVLHESSYADGGVTGWSAARVAPDDFVGDSTLLTAEHLFPWHFEDHPELVPYSEVAGLLAEHEWPRLYDAEVLASVDVPCAAAIYVNDALRRPRVLRGDGRPAARDAALGHRRVPPQRAAHRRWAHPRPPHRPGPREPVAGLA